MEFFDKNLNEYKIDFIKQEDFEHHVAETIKAYDKTLNKIDLHRFNENVIDPIKLTFDKALFHKTWKEIIELEIHRQRDKSNTNAIGYFHQFMFKYIPNCVVPDKGFDVIYTNNQGKKIYVELKNKHNTMNDAAQKDTALKLFNQLLADPDCVGCYLVEVIAPMSRNVVWTKTLRDGTLVSNEKIRRVSIDVLYQTVTGIKDAFYQICRQLPITIEKLIRNKSVRVVEEDTVVQELSKKNPDLLKSLYLLAFESYLGFEYEMNDIMKALNQLSKKNC